MPHVSLAKTADTALGCTHRSVGRPSAFSQAYPNKPVRIVVPFVAGSATDIVARLLADELRGAFDQSFIVDDKPGASARIGAEEVAKA